MLRYVTLRYVMLCYAAECELDAQFCNITFRRHHEA